MCCVITSYFLLYIFILINLFNKGMLAKTLYTEHLLMMCKTMERIRNTFHK